MLDTSHPDINLSTLFLGAIAASPHPADGGSVLWIVDLKIINYQCGGRASR